MRFHNTLFLKLNTTISNFVFEEITNCKRYQFVPFKNQCFKKYCLTENVKIIMKVCFNFFNLYKLKV